MYNKVFNKIVGVTALAISVSMLLSSCCGEINNASSEVANTSVIKNQSTKNASDQKESGSKKDKSDIDEKTTSKPRVDSSYFNDAVFIGDSLTVGLSMYVDAQREAGEDCLGKACVLSAASLGYTNAIYNPAGSEDSRLPIYKGEQQNLEDCVADLGAKKVYIMLGMNDVANHELDETIDLADQLINKIKEKSPSVQIYLQSVTSMIRSMSRDDFDNDTIRAFNQKLKEYAFKNGHYYLDIYSAVSDKDGYLKDEYCIDADDMGMHFNFVACKVWEDYLMAHPDGN